MHDLELKKLLEETHPVRPGQEERAWSALKERLSPPPRWTWLYYPTWRGAAVGLLALCLAVGMGDYTLQRALPISFVSADSQSPGIYATAFYSNSAHAQVVWLNGLNPATDQPTYLDNTTVISGNSSTKSSPPANTPDRL